MTAASERQRPIYVVAFGGNALQQPGDLGTVEEQLRRAEAASVHLIDLVGSGCDLVVVHGNGPQVGTVMLQMEEASTKVPPATLDVAVAQTQGSMGYLIELALRNRAGQERRAMSIQSLLTLVVVDRDDPGFDRPTKPVGPFFSTFRARALQREMGWAMVEDSGRGWRKLVASPRPLDIVNLELVRRSLESGGIVIAAGGGGVPVVREADGQLVGVEAVIDKDRTSALLADRLGASKLINLTGVPQVMRGFGTAREEPIGRMTVSEARELLDAEEFPPGSMGPKVESCVRFVENTGRPALVTDIETMVQALDGRSGTLIVPDGD